MDNPNKRRKVSQETEVPIDAPSSPSKIPVPARKTSQSQDGAQPGSRPRRPSYASPTKASLAKHNPQIIQRTGPSGGQETATDVNARATGVKASIENVNVGGEVGDGRSEVPQTPIQGETGDAQAGLGQEISQTHSLQTQGMRSVTGSMASAPRRRSRTPGKPASQTSFDPARNASDTWGSGQPHGEQTGALNTNLFGFAMEEEELLAGPIRRPALRRSPTQSQTESQPHSQPPRFSPTENPDTGTAANIGIVRKPALRRSPPIGSQSNSQSQSQRSAEKIETGPGPIRKAALRRSPPQIQDLTRPQPEPTQNQTVPEFHPEPEPEIQPEPEPTQHTTPTHSRHQQRSHIPERDQEIDTEPELPPTPVQLGLEDPVVTTPPTGIHDTPSKRKSKKRDHTMARGTGSQAAPSRPSPLKERTHAQFQSQAFSADMAPKPLPRHRAARLGAVDASTPAEVHSRSPDDDIEMTGVSRHGSRPPPDIHATKRKLRDQLLQELQELQADVLLAESENERLYNLHESGTEIGGVAQNNPEIESLLRRSGYGDEKDATNEMKPIKPLSSFHALSSFLPFSAPIIPQPPQNTNEENDSIPSHLPLKQENPLPYLQLFTPLQFSSAITVLPSSSDPDTSILSTSTTSSTEILKDIIQSHVITAHSAGSTSLFKSEVSILVNTTTFSIISISINSLSPAAEPELGSFLRKITNAGEDDVLAGNVATLFWAMGRWYDTAKKRAIFWVRIEEEFGTKSEFATRSRKNKGVGKKRGRKRRNDDEGGNDEEINTANNDDETYRKLTRKEYLSNMGRQSATLFIPIPSSTTTTTASISLRIEWKISFDWTGETESSIGIGVLGGWPGSWRKNDTRNCLSKLPGTFERMVKERGPLSAIRGVVELLDGVA